MKKCTKLGLWTCLFCVVILASCSTQVKETIVLVGESENWRVEGYELELTPEKLKVGNGIIINKYNRDYKTDYFSFHTHVVISAQDEIVHSGSVSGDMVHFEEKSTGTIEGETLLNGRGKSISLNDISEMYMVISWRDVEKGYDKEERINLFSKAK
ncbi:hypothetical protein FZW96_13975 [Bacillus sp. BGMRC 2118]|nr:hypothetical protein FZW96_13975 [Bacillus sp. BGMRC 2118]